MLSRNRVFALGFLSLTYSLSNSEGIFLRKNSAAIVSNAPGCAQIGRNIMEKGGNVIDTAIATAFCEGVVNPTSMGIGGGFIATIFNKASGKVIAFNARETAPAAATEKMFQNKPELSVSGGLSVAIPSELIGFWDLFNKFGGKVSWAKLIEPTIKMCTEGIVMSNLTYKFVTTQINLVLANPELKKIFINPETNEVYKVGEFYKRPVFANTLKIIAKEGGTALHNGSLTKLFVKDVQEKGGIITEKDLNDYRTEVLTPVHTKVAGKDVYSFPLPSSGSLLIYILNILENYVDSSKPVTIQNVQRLAEALKFAYAKRTTLGDRKFVTGVDDIIANLTSKDYAKEIRKKIFDNQTFSNPSYYGAYNDLVEDHGTANICVWGINGDGIALTSSINYVLGAGFASRSTDIIPNNSMDDFSSPGITNVFGLPPSPSNFIRPGKQPMSSMAPTIILDKYKHLYMIAGGAGGSRILGGVTQVVLNRLYYKMDVSLASDSKRIHHQFLPMNLELEEAWLTEDSTIPMQLRSFGHNITFVGTNGFSAVTCISVSDNRKTQLVGVFDKRRSGSVAYL